MKQTVNTIVLGLGLCILAGHVQADIAELGALSYDTFIGGSSGFPGIDAFNLANLTGAFNLPPDFPVSDSLTFQSASLTLTLNDLSQEVFNLGDIGPGFLLDSGGNPVVQVPGDQLFKSAEFTATLSPGSFALFDGTSFVADSTALDVVLQPSNGPTLVADTDQTTIGVQGTIVGVTPEPSLFVVLLLVCTCLVLLRLRRKTA
jgi:hypothetical protein